MEEFELDYDVQEVRLSKDHVFKVTTVANDALPIEMLLDLQTRSEEISGQRLWEGSLLLCAYLVEASNNSNNDGSEEKLDLRGRAVLELGAGTGVVSMLAHSLGASPVVMTDGDDECVVMAAKNIDENGISTDEAFVTTLRWGDEVSTTAFCNAFSDWTTPRLAEWKETVTARNGVVAAFSAEQEEEAEETASLLESQTDGAGVPAELGQQAPCCPAVLGGGMLHRPPRTPGSRTPSTLRCFDYILAGDVLYKQCLLEPFLRTVHEMLAPGGRTLLCHVPRAGVTYDIVEQAVLEAGFEFVVVYGKRSSDEEGGAKRGENGAALTAVGGIELCVDDARRARLYELRSATLDCVVGRSS